MIPAKAHPSVITVDHSIKICISQSQSKQTCILSCLVELKQSLLFIVADILNNDLHKLQKENECFSFPFEWKFSIFVKKKYYRV